jgi:hypothetical protein
MFYTVTVSDIILLVHEMSWKVTVAMSAGPGHGLGIMIEVLKVTGL